ncbi:MAG TPA: hypothetical protein VHZ09_14680 [Acidobacteriaceae bacterium]|jgi:hypothetical protein|nr:hypothetical protein [Acidobacteriaceae bacterium]
MKARCFLLFPSLLLSLVYLQACGAPATPPRQLLSVTVTPSTATAQGAGVQFVATGTYNTAPYTVTPLTANWGIAVSPKALGTITQSGFAACTKGASGTSAVEAWVMTDTGPICNVIDSAGRPGCGNVWGSAQLACP